MHCFDKPTRCGGWDSRFPMATGRPEPVRYGNGIQFWMGALNIEVYDNRIWQIYDTPLTNQGQNCTHSNNRTACAMQNISYHHNLISNSGMACVEIWYQDRCASMDNVRFENNICLYLFFLFILFLFFCFVTLMLRVCLCERACVELQSCIYTPQHSARWFGAGRAWLQLHLHGITSHLVVGSLDRITHMHIVSPPCNKNPGANMGDGGWSAAQRPDPAGRVFCSYTNSAATTAISVQNNIFFQTKGFEALLYISDRWSEWAARGLQFNNNVLYRTRTLPIGPSNTAAETDCLVKLPADRKCYTATNFTAFASTNGVGAGTLLTNPCLAGMVVAVDTELQAVISMLGNVTRCHPLPNSSVLDAGTHVEWRADFAGVPLPRMHPSVGPFEL